MYVSNNRQQSAEPSVSGASNHPQPSISPLPSYTSNPPFFSPAARTTSLPSYNQISAPPPGYTSLNPNLAQLPVTISAPLHYQLEPPQPFLPQGYAAPQQYSQPVFYAPSPLGQRGGVQYSYPQYQPQAQGQILQPAMGYEGLQPQPYVIQPYSSLPQYGMPMSYIQQGSQPQSQISMLYRVVESDEEEEEEEKPKKGDRMPVRGVRYHIGGGKK